MKVLVPQSLSSNIRLAIVVSRFNEEFTEKLLTGILARLKERGIEDQSITVVWVPGAVEIPITAQRLAKTKQYAAIICAGAVIQGETKHFDYVCQQVSQGCQQVALAHDLPLIFSVLTVENEEQALARLGGEHGHIGRFGADAACDLISVLHQL